VQRRAFLGLSALVAVSAACDMDPDPFSIPPGPVSVNVDSTTTLGSGGTLAWWGRASIARRPNGVLMLAYQRATAHDVNNGTGIHLRMSDNNGATWSDEDKNVSGSAITGAPLVPPSLGANMDAGEPWLTYTPDGDLLCFTWRVDYNVTNDGTCIFRSTDDGETWDSGTDTIDWSGLNLLQDSRTFCTDDGFNIGSTMYVAGRVYAADDYSSSAVVMMTSTDDGVSWSCDATLVSPEGPPTHGAIELGMERVGNSDFIAMIRDTDHEKSYRATSSNLGARWSALEDVSSTVGIAGRQRVYTRAHLKGQANWWNDPVVLMVGYVHQTPGQSQDRRNCVWVSRDHGVTWSTPYYIDSTTEDAGYGDIFYDADNDQYVVVNYQGTLAAASLKQYRLTIAGV
jgi:hypothetical protein